MGSDIAVAQMLRGGNGELFDTMDTTASVVAAPTAFAGGTTNARGDDGGTSDPLTLFTVTGTVLVRVFGEVTVDLVSAGGGTVSLGVTGNVAAIIAATTATDLDDGDLFTATTPPVGTDALTDVVAHIVGAGANIVEATGTADITAGNIRYICLWRPLEPDSSVVAA